MNEVLLSRQWPSEISDPTGSRKRSSTKGRDGQKLFGSTRSKLKWAFFGGSLAFVITSKWMQGPQEAKDQDARKMYLLDPVHEKKVQELENVQSVIYPNGSKWAYAVSLAWDNPKTNELAHGVCTLLKNIERKRPIGKHFIAMIPPDESLVPRTSIEIMKRCRVRVIELSFPLVESDLKDEEYLLALRDRNQAGLGLREFHKINVWRLTEFESVAFMDIDVYIVRLMDKFFYGYYDFVFTDGPYASFNGGFFVAKPNMNIFMDMVEKIKRVGAYRKETGWYNSGALGRANATPQGFLFWYWGVLHRERSKKLNRCLWNRQLMKGSGNKHCAENYALEETFIYHFVECPGPRKFAMQENIPRKPFLLNHTEIDNLNNMRNRNEIKPPMQEECLYALRGYVWSRQAPIVQRKEGPPYFQPEQ